MIPLSSVFITWYEGYEATGFKFFARQYNIWSLMFVRTAADDVERINPLMITMNGLAYDAIKL